ncbi:MAG: DUF1015 domain-containing protein [Clostridiales bacterium]|nr:DUF1015 domain-containing protein [Clostridiales bacterium]
MDKKFYYPADIMLPDFNKVSGTKWAVIACDQYTSEPEYWQKAEEIRKNSPSTLSLIIPEGFLSEAKERIPKINAEMEKYVSSVLKTYKNSVIYTERVQKDGKVKHGIVCMVDLEEYDYKVGSKSLIRATEGTVLERIPPRVEIRKDAPIELPHIMLLIDDDNKTVIEPITQNKKNLEKIYDFELMQGGGSVSGYLVNESDFDRINLCLSQIISDENANRLYGNAPSKLLYAVGDGNHSLATARTCYLNIKEKYGEEVAKNHPSRYALVEIVNLHDDALEFEPIYRVVFGVDREKMLVSLKNYAQNLNGNEKTQVVDVYFGDKKETIVFEKPEKQLTVGTLQDFIDAYLKENGGEVDYIHGEDVTINLSKKDGAIGFIFSGIEKNQLFKTVIYDGALPRKTFSIGHAYDKRYYIECRKIK